MTEALVLVRTAAVAVLPVKPSTVFPVLNQCWNYCWENHVTSWPLVSPLIDLPSLVDGLFDLGLLDERVAECPLLSDPV